jgi:hypothetical protein
LTGTTFSARCGSSVSPATSQRSQFVTNVEVVPRTDPRFRLYSLTPGWPITIEVR